MKKGQKKKEEVGRIENEGRVMVCTSRLNT